MANAQCDDHNNSEQRKKFFSVFVPEINNERFFHYALLIIMDVIRNPEITKKTSTPIKPPCIQDKFKWNRMTDKTDIALRPSISGRYLKVLHFMCTPFF